MTNNLKSADLLATAKRVLDIEAAAITGLKDRVGQSFADACQLCLNCSGRVVVTGMGKSGHVAGKLAATLASTGTPAFFVHPSEASHGDLGMITREDVILAISNSGETDEITALLPVIDRLQTPMIALTGNPDSSLARAATVNIDVGVRKEACPLDLAPTASTTAALIMGDALAIALLEARGFGPEDFARSHPGGRLGRRLLLRLGDIMHTGDAVPKVGTEVSLSDALVEMTRKSLGMTGVVDDDGCIAGIFTDGDLRRALDRNVDLQATRMRDVMTENCRTAVPEELAAEALLRMEQNKITALLVVDQDRRLVGALHVHDLLRAGVV